MKRYQVSFEVLVDVEADSKGAATDAANRMLRNNAQEYGILSEMAADDHVDPFAVHELDEEGDPIL